MFGLGDKVGGRELRGGGSIGHYNHLGGAGESRGDPHSTGHLLLSLRHIHVARSYDHIHLRSLEPFETAQYFHEMFDAKIMETVQSDGQPRVDIDVNGLIIFIAKAGKDTPPSLKDPHLGLDHFGFRVDNLDEAVKELKERGAEFAVEPYQLRPDLKIAFVRAPGDVRIELLERS